MPDARDATSTLHPQHMNRMPKDKPVPPSGPVDMTNNTVDASPASARHAGSRASAAFDAAPIFRVIEVTRDARGRLRHEGKIWHTDLGRLRKFGRAVAANTASHRVMVADASGNVLEEIPVAPTDDRAVKWSDWEAIPLPPLPPRAKRPAPLKRKALPAAPSPAIPATLGLEASVAQALQGAAVEARHAPVPLTDAAVEADADVDASGDHASSTDVELP